MSGAVPFPWHVGVFDAHCHPTDTLESLQEIPGMRANVLTVMATRAEDQVLVADAAEKYGVCREDLIDAGVEWSEMHKIAPAFGWHPWFSHQMYDESAYDGVLALSTEQKSAHYRSVLTPTPDDDDLIKSLPDPKPFGVFLTQTRAHLARFPLALIGEVGLDKSFRIPLPWDAQREQDRSKDLTPGGREGRPLSPYRVDMSHQRAILLAQLRMAGTERRAVSVHGVAAHGILYDTLAETWQGQEREILSKRQMKKRGAASTSTEQASPADGPHTASNLGPAFPPRICLHSYSGPAETVTRYTARSVPCEVFFSFSATINSWSDDGNGKVEAAVRAVPDDRLLMESDLHVAGERMDGYLQEIAHKLCAVKCWPIEDGMKRLRENWKRFILGPIA